MIVIRNFTFGLLLVALGAAVTFAQVDRLDARPAASSPTVTVSVSAKGVRFAALGSVKQIRLEVLSQSTDDTLYSSGFQPGNVRDWALEDSHGQRLPDGTYLCVVTVRDLSGRLSIRQGSVLVQSGQASLQLGEADQAGSVEPDRGLAPMTNDPAAAVTLTAHDGSTGQVVSTRGGLTFRAGDFFAGKDRELMRLTPEGDLGVGVVTPTAKLDVAGTIRARGGIQFGDGTVLTTAGRALRPTPAAATATGDGATANLAGTGTANKLAKWFDGSGTLGDSAVTEVGGFLGVGTTSPSTPVDIVYSDNAFGFGVNIRNTNTGSLALVGYGINSASGSRVGQFVYVPPGYADTSLRDSTLFSSVGPTAKLGFVSSTDGSGTPDIYIRAGGAKPNSIYVQGATGNVGVGTNSPMVKLDVAGSLKVSGSAVVDGNIAAKYQDVAEWVQAKEPLVAGIVVILDPTRTNTVMPSKRSYDTHVAGVVSAQPGVILGQGGVGKVMVATTGRVKVRVDASHRPIRVGDLLVTSGRSGMAMRSLPIRVGGAHIHRPGTIIGKALEPLTKGEGEILVLLGLQ